MGFKVTRRTIGIRFEEDHPLHGLEIDVLALSLGELEDIAALPSDMDAFISRIKSWNLQDEEGQPLPISAESLYTLEVTDVRDIKTAWWNAVARRVPAPLGGTSTGGGSSEATTLERSIPMDVQ